MSTVTYKAVAKKTEGLAVEVNARGFKVVIDEPVNAGGADTGMTPIELALGSLGSCQVITALMVAPYHNIDLEDIHVELEGDIDMDSLTGASANAEKGFTEVRFNFHIKSSASDEALKKLIDHVENMCPVGQSLLKEVEMGQTIITQN